MFSGFFNGLDGCGTLRMMVCINPREADFDESLNVMEFAETTKKIQIERVDPRARFLNTPGMIYRKQLVRNTCQISRRIKNSGPEIFKRHCIFKIC